MSAVSGAAAKMRGQLYIACMFFLRIPLIPLVAVLACCGCGYFASEKMHDAFEEANSGLTDSVLASTEVLDNKYEHLRSMACAEGRMWSDSVALLYERASERMFALDELLTGPNIGEGDPVQRAFAEDGPGNEALNASLALYAMMEQVTIDESAKARIAEMAEPLRSANGILAWYERDFRGAPPPVITASIERYVADMGRAKRLCMGLLLVPCGR